VASRLGIGEQAGIVNFGTTAAPSEGSRAA